MKQPSKEVSAKSLKKPYEPPKLLIYGDLEELTKARGNRGGRDGGRGQRRQTGA